LSNKMIKRNQMLMIGSAGSNVGKTQLACALIERFSKDTPIVGIKVTAIEKQDEKCPRGGEGCGVCASMEGNFSIVEEFDSTSNKDTCRLLAAGARRVLWLRVLKEHIVDGAKALLDILGPDTVCICESNSLRSVIEPGLFLMVTTDGQQDWKNSARQVKDYADRIVVSHKDGFDIDQVKLVNDNWTMADTWDNATAIIMAGGSSQRMGQDKSMLQIGGRTMIQHIFDQLAPHFRQILISANDPTKYDFLSADVICDQAPGRGPLMGIASAMKASANELNFVTACDIPRIDIPLVRKMLREIKNYDAVIPVPGPSKREPLFAIYRKSALPRIEKALASGTNCIIDAFEPGRIKYIELTNSHRINNINTVADYREFVRSNNDDKV